jgi:hypothetical protein
MDTSIQQSFNDLNQDVKIFLKKYYDIKTIKNYNFYLNKKKLEIKELDEIIYFDKYLIEIQDNEIVKEEETEREIDPKYIKILNNYYNEDEIKYYFKKNIIIVEKDGIEEYLYFDEYIKKDTHFYYRVLYDCFKNKSENIFIIQIGSLTTFKKMIKYIDIISKVNENYIFTFVEDTENKKIINLLKKKLTNFTVLEVKNKGMDIGIFLISLLYLRDKNLKYKNLIKIHTKTDDRFREHVCDQLIGSEEIIKKNLKLMDKSEIGMLNGTFTFDYQKNKSFFKNHLNYLEYLISYFLNDTLDKNKLEFAVGTFFISKFDVFNIFNKNNIKILYNKLNDENTLDINWYKIFYELKNKNDDYIINHWKKNKKKNYGNNLELQIKTKCSGMRDFMIEHALERFFGYLNKYKNYIMLEI